MVTNYVNLVRCVFQLKTVFPVVASVAANTAATAPASAGDPMASPLLTTLTAAGMCVLVVWAVLRIIRRDKFRLANTPGRANNLTVIHILLVFCILPIASAAAYWLMGTDSVHSVILSATITHLLVFAGGLVMAAFAFELGVRRGLGLSLRRWRYDVIRGVLTYLAILPVCVGLLALSSWILPAGVQKEHRLLQAIGESPLLWRTIAIFSAVVLAPLSEEVFFRGLIQSMVRRYARSRWLGIIIASALFALAHWPAPQTILPLLALGLALGYNYERTGRLLAPILTHAIFNVVMIVASG